MAKQYYVAHAHTVTDLEKVVNAKLADGWELQGGISGMRVYSKDEPHLDKEFGPNSYTYVQAMVKTS